MPSGKFNVAIIGGGVVGSAISRDLARHGADCVLIDAADDVGTGTSKANTAILHTGFDAEPGSLEARLLPRGHELLSDFAQECGIPLSGIGALLVAWNDAELNQLPIIKAKAETNGYLNATMVESDDLYRREPALGPGALGALEIPDEGILCPWTTTLALASDACAGGCRIIFDAKVTAIDSGRPHTIRTARGSIQADFVVNAAGLYGDEVDAMMGHQRFSVVPRRGQLIVFDKLAAALVNQTILPVPTEKSKGVLIAPTVYGNVMLGPTAEDLTDKRDTATTDEGLAGLMVDCDRIMPTLSGYEVTATYAGLRAATSQRDYHLYVDSDQKYAVAGGIRSTGLSASMAIAEYLREELRAAGLELTAERKYPPPAMPNIGEAELRPYQSEDLIETDPDNGRIVCFCERVTKAEISAAFESQIPPVGAAGLKRRTRAGMGRCQGFFCGAVIEDEIEERVGS